MGAMSLPQYELKHNMFGKAMRSRPIHQAARQRRDARRDGRSQSGQANHGQYPTISAADWSGKLFLPSLDNIDMLSEHYYASGTHHTGCWTTGSLRGQTSAGVRQRSIFATSAARANVIGRRVSRRAIWCGV